MNRRLVEMERTSHNCVIAPRTFESIVLPSETEGQRVPALRFGDPRVMALLAAWCIIVPAPRGVRNAILRPHVAALLGHDYTSHQMTYDLRRLRQEGLIERLPHSHRYVLTPLGRRVALFFTKAFIRILRPGLARIDPALPPDASDPLAAAWRKMDAAATCWPKRRGSPTT